jgi:N-acetylmuramoyl-L-alanine amidase
VKRIVIDAGHGGDQYGAISRSGVSEKDITLDIARRLRQLMAETRFQVLMTRETDESVPLVDRVAFANANRAATGSPRRPLGRWRRSTSGPPRSRT